MHDTSPSAIVTRGAIGMLATAVGLAISYAVHIETYLRALSLLVGLGVGIITIVSIFCKLKRDSKRFEHEVSQWSTNKHQSDYRFVHEQSQWKENQSQSKPEPEGDAL